MSRTVVVADDSKLSRQLVKKVFERIGFDIVGEAADGLDALELYNKFKPDIITLDILMPHLKGIDAIEKILENNPGANIIVVSALGLLVDDALKAGAKKFLQKPFLVSELVDAVEHIMGEKYEQK